MATSTSPTAVASSTFAEAFTQMGELNEKLVNMARESGQAYLSTYEKAVQGVLDFQKAAAAGSQLDWVNALVTAHAGLVQDANDSYVQLVRQALK